MLFRQMAADLRDQGYTVCPNALPETLVNSLMAHLADLNTVRFQRAGVGRQEDHTLNKRVRTDAISWICDDFPAGSDWLSWTGELQRALNEQLLLGLFSFESHFAHYRPGDFYRRHVDAFRGGANRRLSLVVYLNPDWQLAEGGELLLYTSASPDEMFRILPCLGTVVLFLSEEFPHEVLPATRDRYSIAGWFRVNSSTAERVDPPT
ncbi:2OG-Fe(II) oxygenase [Kineobactrum sediminis]|uniref:2OG-Fe(II) oxygenase n=1 Tax=Kineobactrum sediminis TaxID=1905677 RepID=A0A2N5XYI3_9GAMM|nr:2OG-Fe(II) oxygenase [Kineobactrum sediminis]PLW81196.1 2OG-Fe(II) oxygenase [Kineobactrum sediminis]